MLTAWRSPWRRNGMRAWSAAAAIGLAAGCTALGFWQAPTRAAGAEPAYTGVVEGYYGPPWPEEDAVQLLQFLRRHGMNTFVYAPKDDPYQRADWNLLYPPAQLASLRRLVQAAAALHIQFIYSISPGLTITYSRPADRAALIHKLDQLLRLGVSTVMLSFDDVYRGLDAADRARYGGDMAYAQADLAAYVLARERRAHPSFRLLFTPTVYRGVADNPYWDSLRRHLPPGVPVIWTGPATLAGTITAAQAEQVERWLGHPLIIWDNYPVNDYTYILDKRPRLFLGPLTGRDPKLPRVVAGYLFNPMQQARASEIALWTGAEYLAHPGTYRPQAAWDAAVRGIGGRAAQALAAFARYNATYYHDNTPPAWLTREVQSFWRQPAREDGAQSALARTFREMRGLDAALAKLPDPRLYREIRPWSAVLALQGEAGSFAISVVAAARRLGPAAAEDAAYKAAWRKLSALVRQVDACKESVAGDAIPAFLHQVLAKVPVPAGITPNDAAQPSPT
ncbi:MAG: beta-N-acetylglucosaminidase domain-containing protein [Chloroflexi bacterium]|nr:beta-N-acetylglucosaminidase domain-containing protein [Chloroflexota bacterium]